MRLEVVNAVGQRARLSADSRQGSKLQIPNAAAPSRALATVADSGRKKIDETTKENRKSVWGQSKTKQIKNHNAKMQEKGSECWQVLGWRRCVAARAGAESEVA